MYLVLAWLFILLRQGTNGGQGANLSYWVDKSIFRAFFVFKDEKIYVFYFLHKPLHFNFVVSIVLFINWWWLISTDYENYIPHFELLILWAHLIMKSTKASLLVILANNNMKNTIHFTITSVLFVFRINCVFYHLIPCAIASNFPKTVSGNLYQRKCIRTYCKKVNRCKSIQVHACNIWYTHMNFKKISWT